MHLLEEATKPSRLADCRPQIHCNSWWNAGRGQRTCCQVIQRNFLRWENVRWSVNTGWLIICYGAVLTRKSIRSYYMAVVGLCLCAVVYWSTWVGLFGGKIKAAFLISLCLFRALSDVVCSTDHCKAYIGLSNDSTVWLLTRRHVHIML